MYNLYKAKTVLTNTWVYGFYWQNFCGNHFIRACKHKNYIISPCDFEIDKNTLCMSINYKDDNNQEIFTNDIVRFYSMNKVIHSQLVWFCKENQCMTDIDLNYIFTNGFDFYSTKKDADFTTFTLMLKDLYGDYSKIEVIGNIIDNPGLLKLEAMIQNKINTKKGLDYLNSNICQLQNNEIKSIAMGTYHNNEKKVHKNDF